MSSLAHGRIRPKQRKRGGSAIRWDRVGRWALVLLLGVILALYISPLKNYLGQRGTAAHHRQELRQLESQNTRLKREARQLQQPATLERAARNLGMVRKGERAYVITNVR